MKARWSINYVCKNEEQLIERLDQAILDVINNPKRLKVRPILEHYSDKRSIW